MNHDISIHFLRIRPDRDADIPLPSYMTPHASGMDIYAAVKNDLVMEPGEVSLIPTGFAIALPRGFEAQIRPRSGLAAKHSIGIINAPGSIDADYRGEIMILLINFGKMPYTVRRKDRIAQMIIQRVYRAEPRLVEKLDETERNTGGLGHTGR